MPERKSIECRCRGKIDNCIHCRGTGIIEDKDAAEKIDEKLSETRVAHCNSCGRQNRMMDDFLKQGGEPLCYACGSPIFSKGGNAFDLTSSIRNKKKQI